MDMLSQDPKKNRDLDQSGKIQIFNLQDWSIQHKKSARDFWNPADFKTFSTWFTQGLRNEMLRRKVLNSEDFIWKEFPQIYEKLWAGSPEVNAWLFLDKKGSCRGMVSALMRWNKTDFGSFPVCILSNLAVHPDFQGQGIAKALTQEVLKWAENKKAIGVVLWSDLELFYSKLGFQKSGEQIFVEVPQTGFLKNRRPLPSTWRFARLESEGKLRKIWPYLEEWQEKRTWGCWRVYEDWSFYLKIPKCEFHILEDENESLKALWVIGKGHDLQGILHEYWGPAALYYLPEQNQLKRHWRWCLVAPNDSSQFLANWPEFSHQTQNCGWVYPLNIQENIFDKMSFNLLPNNIDLWSQWYWSGLDSC